MNHLRSIIIATAALLLPSAAGAETLTSPDGRIRLDFSLTPAGTPQYSVTFKGEQVVGTSSMGLKAKGADLTSGFTAAGKATESSFSETWTPVWGENSTIDNTYNQLTVPLTQKGKNGVDVTIEFRAFNDGIAFRYMFPKQKRKHLTVTDEVSEFKMPGDITAWWISGDYDTQEYEYTQSRLSDIRRLNSEKRLDNESQTGFSPTGVQTSLQLKTDNGVYLNIHEAALIDYPAMHLNLDDTDMVFTSWLTPNAEGDKAEIKLPFNTPWRVVMIADKATDILASNIIYNLNDPCALKDTSWIKPVKFMGVWWEMITGGKEWSYCDVKDFDLSTFDYSKAKPHGRHGATNENVRKYIDFAAANGMDQLLVEGWNIGWEDWFGKHKDYVFDFLTPYPDFDIKALNEYAHSKGIKLMMHHETSGSPWNYEKYMDRAYDLMNKYGYNAVKSGYVGDILPLGENHYNQRMVNHYLNAVKKAADKHIMVDAHEAVRPTGLARTYPNLLANESARGQEFQNLPPMHATVLPFTRLKGGPMDFTPGIFSMDMRRMNPNNNTQKTNTVAQQLGLYVTMYSPLQMAADTPEHYAEKMDAFQFIKDVPVDWQKSIYLDAEPGDYIVAARKDKNSEDWYVGAITDENARDYTLRLDFLDPGAKYDATVYSDSAAADAYDNPESYVIDHFTVTSDTVLPMKMARGGGFAISLKKQK